MMVYSNEYGAAAGGGALPRQGVAEEGWGKVGLVDSTASTTEHSSPWQD